MFRSSVRSSATLALAAYRIGTKKRAFSNIGAVKSSEGGKGKVHLTVRGADADKIKFELKSKEPDMLKVTLGEPKKLKDTLVIVPVEIEIPPGTRPMVHLDTVQGEAAALCFRPRIPRSKNFRCRCDSPLSDNSRTG